MNLRFMTALPGSGLHLTLSCHGKRLQLATTQVGVTLYCGLSRL